MLFRFVAALAAGGLFVAGCATTGPYLSPDVRRDATPALPDGEVAYEVFLLGNTADAGARGGSDAVLRAVADEAVRAGEASAVVLLGDQTMAGVPDSSDAGFSDASTRLDRLAETLARVPGRVVVVPGDRDWAEGRRGLRRQERALRSALGDTTDVLVPGDQAGGPVQVELADGLRLVVLDTAWWLLDRDERPDGESEGEDVRSPADVTTLLDRILTQNDDDRRIVVGHHPLRSVGEYAGQRSLARGLLTLGLGPLADQTVGLGRQSLAAPRYARMRRSLDGVLARHDGVVYVSAHDHSLQAFDVRRSQVLGQTYLVSGSGGGTTRAVAPGRGAAFAAARAGYQHLIYYADGTLVAETVLVDEGTGTRTVALRQTLAEAESERVDPAVPARVDPASLPPEIGGTVTQTADADFAGNRIDDGAARRFLWGAGYRDVWNTPVTFDVLDLGTLGGGLTPLQTGGGLQTTGLRLEGADGLVYELRLLEKSGLAQVPEALRAGAVGDVVLDLRSATNPYGPLVTGPLAEAAGVYQPFFKIVYIPDDPRLGRYRETFGDRLAHLSIRPDDDVSAVPGLLGAADVVSEGTLYEKLAEDQDHRVDARAYLRARLLDNVVADWDRHMGQWRWAAFEPGELDPTLTGDDSTKGKVYLPVARDRDFAFHDIGGLFPSVIGYAFDPRLQSFDTDIDRIPYLNQNGFPQDRRLLAPLTAGDWAAVAADLQARLTDAAIDRAVAALPDEIEALVGERYRRTLRERRDSLPHAAERLYHIHAGIVDVVGSDEREQFTASRDDAGRLTVTVASYKGDETGRELYRRVFEPRETDEVRLYGFGGRDRFDITGAGPERIRVRLVGGAGRDTLVATNTATVYDTPDGLRFDAASARQVDERLADDGDVNAYDPNEAVLGRAVVAPVVGYRPTDGAILGASVNWIVPGFRLAPWAATHALRTTVALGTLGVEGGYTGRMRQAFGRLDLDVDVLASTPRYVRNFYGIGNATDPLPGDSARLDLARVYLDAGVGGPLGQGLRFVAGPTLRYADPQQPDVELLRPLGLGSGVTASARPQAHAGAFARLMLTTADATVNPQQGVRLTVGGAYRAAVTAAAEPYGQVGGEGVAYVPLSLAPQLTLALRAGADHRFGAYPFFDAAVLGGEAAFGAASAGTGGTLRGYRRERFAGRTAASASAEARMKLFDVATYVAPFSVGVLGFADAGRVWSDRVPFSDICDPPGTTCPDVSLDAGEGLHLGYGGGLWFDILDRSVLSLTVGRSDEETLVTFGLGFAY